MRTGRGIDISLYLFAPAIVLFIVGLTEIGDTGTRTLGILLAVAGLVLGIVALVGLRRAAKASRHMPPPSPTGKGRKTHHKGAK